MGAIIIHFPLFIVPKNDESNLSQSINDDDTNNANVEDTGSENKEDVENKPENGDENKMSGT